MMKINLFKDQDRKDLAPAVTELAAGLPEETVALLTHEGHARVGRAMGTIRKITREGDQMRIELL